MGDVIDLRKTPSMADIPGMLRTMADDIENGEVQASSMMVIIPTDGDWPDIFGWGEHMGDYGCIGLLEIAKAFFVNNKTERTTGD